MASTHAAFVFLLALLLGCLGSRIRVSKEEEATANPTGSIDTSPGGSIKDRMKAFQPQSQGGGSSQGGSRDDEGLNALRQKGLVTPYQAQSHEGGGATVQDRITAYQQQPSDEAAAAKPITSQGRTIKERKADLEAQSQEGGGSQGGRVEVPRGGGAGSVRGLISAWQKTNEDEVHASKEFGDTESEVVAGRDKTETIVGTLAGYEKTRALFGDAQPEAQDDWQTRHLTADMTSFSDSLHLPEEASRKPCKGSDCEHDFMDMDFEDFEEDNADSQNDEAIPPKLHDFVRVRSSYGDAAYRNKVGKVTEVNDDQFVLQFSAKRTGKLKSSERSALTNQIERCINSNAMAIGENDSQEIECET